MVSLFDGSNIIQEFNLKFSTLKRKKDLPLAYFTTDFPTCIVAPPLNDRHPNEHIFMITTNDPKYGYVLTYICT